MNPTNEKYLLIKLNLLIEILNKTKKVSNTLLNAQYKEINETFKKLWILTPHDPFLYYKKGEVFLTSFQYIEACITFKKGISLIENLTRLSSNDMNSNSKENKVYRQKLQKLSKVMSKLQTKASKKLNEVLFLSLI